MSFRLRLIITISLLVAVSFGFGGAALITASFNASLQKETQSALRSYQTVQSTLYLLNSLGEQTDYDSLANALEQMAQQNVSNWQALSLTAGDEDVYRDGDAALLAAELPQPEADQCAYSNVADDAGHGLLVLSVIHAGEDELLLNARFDLSAVYDARETQQQLYFVIYLAVVYVGILTSVLMTNALTRPLRRLTDTARKIAGGDLSTRSEIHSNDEFGQLSRDFDAMADKLEENFTRLSEEMQRQETFMGAFAHELKTPMTSIIGYADFLRQGDLDDNTRMMAADYIFSEGQRLEKLSFKLLELLLLKNDALVMKTVNLNAFLGNVEKALAPVLRKKNIRLVCRGEKGRVVLEPDLVKSLLYNLIDNASKAMDGEGVIAVKGTILPGGCQFQVVDNGQGMEKAELDKITDAFYRVDKSRSRKQGGAGLGLALCKEIVALHNGTMKFYSVPGTGTRVTVTLYGSEVASCKAPKT